MSEITRATIEFEFAMQRLNQEQVTFDLHKRQSQNWFFLRLAVGYSAVLLLPAIAAICGFIILNPSDFDGTTTATASATLFGDVVGLLVAIWKIVINPESGSKLEPVTQTTLPTAGELHTAQHSAIEVDNPPLQADTGHQRTRPSEQRR